jgi:magnesium chelatase family protein
MNPCPCGYLGSTPQGLPLHARPGGALPGQAVGPLLDRIDLHVEVPALPPESNCCTPPGEATAAVRARCIRGRANAPCPPGQQPNQALQGQAIDSHAALDARRAQFLNTAAARLGWSARATHRALQGGAHHCRPGRRPAPR